MQLLPYLFLLGGAATLVRGEGPEEDAKIFLGSLASCASIDLDLDSCLSSNTIDILVSFSAARGGEPQQAHNNLRRVLAGEEEGCKPNFDAPTIEYAVSEASHACATVSENEIHSTTLAFSTLFGESEIVGECWASTCSFYNDDGNGDGDGDAYDDGNGDDGWVFPEIDIIGAVLDEAMQCPGVTIDPNSCLVSTALQGLDEMMGLGGGGGDASDGGHGSGHRRLIHSIPGLCTPPEIDQDEVRLMLELAAASCSQTGIEVDTQEIDTALNSVVHAFSSTCFDSICHRMMMEALAVGFDSAAACADIPPFDDDCLTRATIHHFADAGSSLRFPQMTLEVCHFKDLEMEALMNKISESGNMCMAEVGGEQSIHTQEDIEELATKLAGLFDATSCWESYCPADDEYYSEGDEDDEGSSSADFFARLMADHLFECAGAGNTSTISTPSCLDTTLENILFYGDFSTAASSSSSATSPTETNNAIQSSVTPVRRHLQQLRQLPSTTSSITKTIDKDNNDNTAYGEFGNEEYPHQDDVEEEDHACVVPELDTEALEFIIAMAKGTCEQGGQVVTDDDIMAVNYKYTALFSASHCWEQLCDDELHLKLIGDYFKDCADIDLPFASGNPTPDDGVLACMIDYAMSTSHAEFGLSQQDPLDQCYPPGHRDVAGTCPSSIAPFALKHCIGDKPADDDFFGSMSYEYGDMDWGWGEDLFFEDQFFFSMSMSYGYGDSDDIDKPPPPPPVDPDRDARLMEDFCMLLEKLSSDKGKQCLLPLCDGITGADNDVLETTAPSTEPSSEPSLQPSLQPSVLPSAVPSVAPSPASSASPSSPPSNEYSNGVVEIRYEAAIKVDGLDVSTIPTSPGAALTKLLTVLTSSISRFLPEDTMVQITSIGGVPVADIGTEAVSRPTTTTSTSDGRLRRYRLLEADTSTGVEIEFEVVSTVECDDVECTDADEISNQAYETMTQDMIQAVDSGDLTSTLQEEAAAADVLALASITIDSFEAEEPTITITEGSDDDSGAGSLHVLTAAAMSVFAGVVGSALFVG